MITTRKKTNESNNSLVSSQKLTFLLKGVNPYKLMKSYFNGDYNEFSMHDIPKDKVEIQNYRFNQINQYGGTIKDERYSIKANSNTHHTLITLNQNMYIKNLDGKALKPTGRCLWCRTNLVKRNILPVGIPVKIYRQGKTITFYIDGEYCTFECCFSGLKYLNSCTRIYRNSIYMDSEQMLRLMFHMIYPDENLKEAPDWRLLNKNNGPLTEQEFFQNTHIYRIVPTIILYPAKLEYIQERV